MYQFWVYDGDERLSSSDYLTLIMISKNENYCTKSCSTLAWESRLDEKTVSKSIKKLVEMGIVTAQKRHGMASILTPNLPKCGESITTPKFGVGQNEPPPKTGEGYPQKRGRYLPQKRGTNNNIIKTEYGAGDSDLKIEREESGESYEKMLQDNNITSISELLRPLRDKKIPH